MDRYRMETTDVKGAEIVSHMESNGIESTELSINSIIWLEAFSFHLILIFLSESFRMTEFGVNSIICLEAFIFHLITASQFPRRTERAGGQAGRGRLGRMAARHWVRPRAQPFRHDHGRRCQGPGPQVCVFLDSPVRYLFFCFPFPGKVNSRLSSL